MALLLRVAVVVVVAVVLGAPRDVGIWSGRIMRGGRGVGGIMAGREGSDGGSRKLMMEVMRGGEEEEVGIIIDVGRRCDGGKVV